MSLRDGSKRRGLMAEMNVVPYIDVMLVLVIILMVSAPFVNPSMINLPAVRKALWATSLIPLLLSPPTKTSSTTPSLMCLKPYRPRISLALACRYALNVALAKS